MAERSVGITVPEWAGPRPGGGYSGATASLDDAVVKTAAWMEREFPGYRVEIRFNSDRRSGVAYIDLDPHKSVLAGRGIGTHIGIVSEGFAEYRPSFRVGSLYYTPVVSNVLLKHPQRGIVDTPDFTRNAETPYYHSAKPAERWLLRNVDRAKLGPSESVSDLRRE